MRQQSQIEDLQNLSKQYEQQEAERMTAEGNDDFFINRPVPVHRQRRDTRPTYGAYR